MAKRKAKESNDVSGFIEAVGKLAKGSECANWLATIELEDATLIANAVYAALNTAGGQREAGSLADRLRRTNCRVVIAGGDVFYTKLIKAKAKDSLDTTEYNYPKSVVGEVSVEFYNSCKRAHVHMEDERMSVWITNFVNALGPAPIARFLQRHGHKNAAGTLLEQMRKNHDLMKYQKEDSAGTGTDQESRGQ